MLSTEKLAYLSLK